MRRQTTTEHSSKPQSLQAEQVVVTEMPFAERPRTVAAVRTSGSDGAFAARRRLALDTFIAPFRRQSTPSSTVARRRTHQRPA